MSKLNHFLLNKYGFFILSISVLSLPFIMLLIWLLGQPQNDYFTQDNEMNNSAYCTLNFENITSEVIANEQIVKNLIKSNPNCNLFFSPFQIREIVSTLNENFPASKEKILLGLIDNLTQHLNTELDYELDIYNPEFLKNILRWTSNLAHAAVLDQENELIYTALADYWYNLVSGKLTDYQKMIPEIKYSFKFRYLVQQCNEALYFVNIEETKIEKVKKNLLANNWIHLIQASWYDSKTWQKGVFLGITFFTIFTYLYTLIHLVNKIKLK
jgi:hypothetical protein